ncbi:MAG: hypothetical protein ACI9J3_001210 [Parvicellaceae bacterium]|jgi:hypothetical protein
MKKVLFATIIIGAFSLTSCKKDYTCTCTITDTTGATATTSSTSTINGKKKDVETACESGNQTIGDYTYACTID